MGGEPCHLRPAPPSLCLPWAPRGLSGVGGDRKREAQPCSSALCTAVPHSSAPLSWAGLTPAVQTGKLRLSRDVRALLRAAQHDSRESFPVLCACKHGRGSQASMSPRMTHTACYNAGPWALGQTCRRGVCEPRPWQPRSLCSFLHKHLGRRGAVRAGTWSRGHPPSL